MEQGRVVARAQTRSGSAPAAVTCDASRPGALPSSTDAPARPRIRAFPSIRPCR